MKACFSRQITAEEDWQITCHEAGHAVQAVKHHFFFEYVQRGEGEHGELKPCECPLDYPDRCWSEDMLSKWQQFYAGGAAAELLVPGRYRPHGLKRDMLLHGNLEAMRQQRRHDAWAKDIHAALQVMDLESIEKVAQKLAEEKKLTDEQVYALFGLKPPWW